MRAVSRAPRVQQYLLMVCGTFGSLPRACNALHDGEEWVGLKIARDRKFLSLSTVLRMEGLVTLCIGRSYLVRISKRNGNQCTHEEGPRQAQKGRPGRGRVLHEGTVGFGHLEFRGTDEKEAGSPHCFSFWPQGSPDRSGQPGSAALVICSEAFFRHQADGLSLWLGHYLLSGCKSSQQCPASVDRCHHWFPDLWRCLLALVEHLAFAVSHAYYLTESLIQLIWIGSMVLSPFLSPRGHREVQRHSQGHLGAHTQIKVLFCRVFDPNQYSFWSDHHMQFLWLLFF